MPTLEQILSLSCRTLSFWGAPVLWALILVPQIKRIRTLPLVLVYAVAVYGMLRSDERAFEQLALYCVALLYFAGLGFALHRYATLLERSFTRPALLLVFFLLFLVLPSFTWPHALGAAFLPLAWETALAAYSYAIESGARRTAPSIRDCLFFLIVDPTLVYLDGECAAVGNAQGNSTRAALRVAWGVLLCGPATFLFVERQKLAALVLHGAPPYLEALARGAVVFFAFYVSHSALASIRIGCVRLLGYQVPERYRLPFLAVSPLDFWNRWNTYVGAWFRYYVFFPLFAQLRRHPYTRAVAPLLALSATMLSVGALHDAYVYASSLQATSAFTRSFAVGTVMIVVWNASVDVLVPRLTKLASTRSWVGWRWLSVVSVVQLVWLCFAWFAP